MKSLILVLLCALPLAAQEPTQPATAIEALTSFKNYSAREKLTGLVEVRGTGGVPTPAVWNIVLLDLRSPTKLSLAAVRGSHVEEKGPSKEFYPAQLPTGYFDMAKVNVDCLGAFRIADREAGKAMVGFDSLDYVLRARELSEDPVWELTLRAKNGSVAGTVTISAAGGKVLRTVWQRPGRDGRMFPEDSAIPQEFRPAPPPKLPDPFPVQPTPAPVVPGTAPTVPAPATPAAPSIPASPPPDPEQKLPPPPPLPPPGTLPPPPRITAD